jgi:hypothetical protein
MVVVCRVYGWYRSRIQGVKNAVHMNAVVRPDSSVGAGRLDEPAQEDTITEGEVRLTLARRSSLE